MGTYKFERSGQSFPITLNLSLSSSRSINTCYLIMRTCNHKWKIMLTGRTIRIPKTLSTLAEDNKFGDVIDNLSVDKSNSIKEITLPVTPDVIDEVNSVY